ncbi:MAG: hypothetical protein H7Z37_13695 [Pyrinomonadaceae bacterium]|nr:hypothetical protein [Pyrinomonadaceae bacterium]
MLKKICSFTLLFVFAFNNLIFAQTKPRPTPKITSPVSKVNLDTTEETKPDDSANDFAESGLPAPKDFGGAPNDALAAALAKQITNYDQDNLPLLITALQRAGFFIINKDNKVLYQPTSGTGMGLAFYDFEVAGMYKLSRRGIVSSVEKFAAQMGKETTALPPSRIADLMMQDLKIAANSSNKLVRFWARLIIEIGKNSPQPVDLSSASSPSVPINIIQASLWERRLIGDIVAFAQKDSAIFQPTLPRKNSVSFTNASYTPNLSPPCSTTEVEGLILDGSSLGITTGHGQLLEQIAAGSSTQVEEKLGKVSAGLGIVNIALSWAKLVAALMTLKGEMKITEPMPLERTKNANEGQTREMTAKIWAEVGNKQFLNCVRLAINASSGLDFSMPNDGPLTGRDISWEFIGKASFEGQGSSKTGKFDNYVNLKSPDGAKPNPREQITDDNGMSKMNIVGAPKIPTVINQPVVPIRKKATVKVAVSLKSSRDKMQNFIDILGATLGVGLGGPISILGSLPELGFRLKWDIRNLTIPVKDWELCTEDWAGTVEYKRVYKQSFVVNTASRKGTRTVDEKTEITWEMNPRKRDMPFDTPPIPADVSVRVDNSDVFEGTGEADVCCNDKESKDAGARIREAITLKVDNETNAILKIGLSDNFLLSIYPFIGYTSFIGIKRRSFTVSESACPVDEDQTAESETEATAESSLEFLRNTKTKRKLSLKGAGGESVEEIEGTETFDDPRGGEIIYIWSLARCGD